MRIAMFSWESLHSIFIGGLGVHVTELAAGLERRGHEVHLITRRKANQNPYDLVDGVHYHRIDHEVTGDDFVVSMDKMCQSMAAKFRDITTLVGHFDLLHAHDWLTGNAMKYSMQTFGTKGILSMHSTEYGRDGNVFYDGFAREVRDCEAEACFHADQIICVSSFLAEEVERIYAVPHNKIHVVPNGVNYHAFDGFIDPAAVKAEYGIAPLAPTVFAAGRMSLQKGMDMLVEAVPMVLASYPETKFVISGSGPEKDNVVRIANQIGVGDSVIFLDALPRHKYIDLVRAVDVVAVPSRNEPFGIVILEAWAAGKPVVTTTVGGPREFVWHNVNGFHVDANPGGLAHGIGSLLADHDHCRALGQNGRKACEDMFNWDNVAQYTEGVYQYVLDNSFAY
ncbi:glycosyl transferase family 1 [Planctomycetales bacterium]|nr:glycosyl transferase family 1 [Planctomycetales bacterium]GHV20875.1 glycosyl transferase family 1 [Planctomycetales bacterium]